MFPLHNELYNCRYLRCGNTLRIKLINFKDGKGVSGAVFSLSSGDSVIYDTTNAFGEAVFPELADGEYLLLQTVMPDGYVRQEVNMCVLVQMGRIYVNHTGQNLIVIPAIYSASFKIGISQNGRKKPCEKILLCRGVALNCRPALTAPLSELLTDNNGEVCFQNIAPGEYTVLHKSTCAAVRVQVREDGVIYINDKQSDNYTFEALGCACLKVRVSSYYECSLADICISITDNGLFNCAKQTNSEGVACFELPMGFYTGEVTGAACLEPDGSVFSIEVDNDGIISVNGTVTDFFEITLLPKKANACETFFFVKDECGCPIACAPFTVSSDRDCQALCSDSNGKVVITSLCASLVYIICPHCCCGYETPEPFTLYSEDCVWKISGDAAMLSCIVYRKCEEQPFAPYGFVWCDENNKNNTRCEVFADLYVNNKLCQTAVINVNNTVQGGSFILPTEYTNYSIEIRDIPKGYRLIEAERGFILELEMIEICKEAVLSVGNIFIDREKVAVPYGSCFTLCHDRFVCPLKAVPNSYKVENAANDATYTFNYKI